VGADYSLAVPYREEGTITTTALARERSGQTTRVERREFQLCMSSEEECMTGRDTLALHSLLLSYRLLVLSLLHEEECD